jgi:hypothetical protein
MLNASQIFWNEVNLRFEPHKLKFDIEIEKALRNELKIEVLKTWIKNIDSLFEVDFDKLKDDLYSQVCFKLNAVLELNFSEFELKYLQETKKLGYNFNAITKPDIKECL